MSLRSSKLAFRRPLSVAFLAAADLSCAPPSSTPPSDPVPTNTGRTAAPGASDDGLALLHKLQDAVGGGDRIAAVRDFEQTILGETWDQQGRKMEVRKRVRWIRPNHLRLDQVGPGNTFVLYYDGTGGWEILPDGRVLDLAGGELEFARHYLRGFVLTHLLADRDPTYVVSSPAPNVVRITDREDEASPTDFTLDPETGLPLKETGMSLADPDHPVSSETQYADWETVEGIKFTRRFSKFHAGVHVAEATVVGIRINSGLDPAVLSQKPADGKPVLGP